MVLRVIGSKCKIKAECRPPFSPNLNTVRCVRHIYTLVRPRFRRQKGRTCTATCTDDEDDGVGGSVNASVPPLALRHLLHI
eukprot:scaffold661734_cov71-Attheya_sp.AAC.2